MKTGSRLPLWAILALAVTAILVLVLVVALQEVQPAVIQEPPTATRTPTSTPAPPTVTSTWTPTSTSTSGPAPLTATRTPTWTPTATSTATPTPTNTETPPTSTLTVTASPTPAPGGGLLPETGGGGGQWWEWLLWIGNALVLAGVLATLLRKRAAGHSRYVPGMSVVQTTDTKLERLAWPFDRAWPVSSSFRAHKNRRPPSKFPGVDIAASAGTPILAPMTGKVTWVGETQAGGHGLWLTSFAGTRVYMAHMREKPIVRDGDFVTEGDVLGFVGATGKNCSGPHLHLSAYLGKQELDPELLFKARGTGTPRTPVSAPPTGVETPAI